MFPRTEDAIKAATGTYYLAERDKLDNTDGNIAVDYDGGHFALLLRSHHDR